MNKVRRVECLKKSLDGTNSLNVVNVNIYSICMKKCIFYLKSCFDLVKSLKFKSFNRLYFS